MKGCTRWRVAPGAEDGHAAVSDEALKVMIVESMNLARAGQVTLYKKQIVRRGEHNDAAPPA